ncbi:methyltransferase domain-containing protein [Candidatus Sororendozoicomonas aggregata]|uniref:methyltransferase domain-containing protein n=1 Tax=Candidatus Sororendozoicomonas aggregata TaxID=3073239 RepID=UPI002ED56CD6
MVSARTAFLNTGHYQPIAAALSQSIKGGCSQIPEPVIIDAGCGEGYYTHYIKRQMTYSHIIGFDISKSAIVACCKQSQQIHWLVASVNDIPVADSSTDIIFSVFSRCDWASFSRILKSEGRVFVIAPGPDHLKELREVIYDTVRPYPEDKLLQTLPDSFVIISRQHLQGKMYLEGSEVLLNLLAMTPHYWRIQPQQKKRFSTLGEMVCHYDVYLTELKYTS